MEVDTALKFPYSMMILSTTGSGKSTFVLELIKRRKELHNIEFKRILYVYSEWQTAYESADPAIEFLSSISELEDKLEPYTLIVIDDMMEELETTYNKFVISLYTKKVHHSKLAVILLLQNTFPKNLRAVSLNSTYVLIGPFPRDNSTITSIARQVKPDNIKFIQYIYNRVMKKPYSFLFLDFHVSTPNNLRYRSSIYPLESEIYMPV